MSIISKICGSLEARLNQPRLSILRTIYFNFRTLPFSQAIKFPVYIYGKVRLFMLNGSVEFRNTEVKRGMVKIGKNAESFSVVCHSSFISLADKRSKMIFEGPATISVNAKIRVVGNGHLTFGKFAYIGSDVRIVCNGGTINIGEYSRIAYETNIMNSGFHHVYNSNKNSITRATRPVEIGGYNWIGNRSTISAGTRTKPFTIVSSNSLLNKDYTKAEEEKQFLGGQPAKIIASGMQRIFSPQLEKEVSRWFNENPNEDIYYPQHFNDEVNNIEQEF